MILRQEVDGTLVIYIPNEISSEEITTPKLIDIEMIKSYISVTEYKGPELHGKTIRCV